MKDIKFEGMEQEQIDKVEQIIEEMELIIVVISNRNVLFFATDEEFEEVKKRIEEIKK